MEKQYRQALWLRDKFKLNPLLVCCTYPPEQLLKREQKIYLT